MIERAFRAAILIISIWATGKWIIQPVVAVKLSEPALVTAVVCCTIVLLTVVIPFIVRK